MTRLDHRVGRFQAFDLEIRSTTPAKRLEIDGNQLGRMLDLSWRTASEQISPGLPRHNHCGSKADTAIEIEYVRVEHPNAAIGHRPADRCWIVRAVDGLVVASQKHYRRTQRIVRRATGDQKWQIWFIAPYDGRWHPRRPQSLAVDEGGTTPLPAGTSDANRIAHGLTPAEHVIQRPLVGANHHGAGRIIAGETDDLTGLRGLRRGRSKYKCDQRGCQPS